MCLGIVSENDDIIFDGRKLSKSSKEKILGVIIDNDLKFDPHIRSMCEKAAQKLAVLNRYHPYWTLKRKDLYSILS